VARFRNLLIGFAQVIMVVIVVGATIFGFVTAGSAGGAMYGGFSGLAAILGAIVGFVASCAAMSVLAILLDIRQTLLRIEAARAVPPLS
jgi:uncharacterized membrane protein